MATYNADRPEADQIAVFDESAEAWPQINKLAFWMATGSGKTLLMHVNILQYQHVLTQHGRQHELNRILLLTPNEGLSQQHLHEFEAAGIDAELFNKDGCGRVGSDQGSPLRLGRAGEGDPRRLAPGGAPLHPTGFWCSHVLVRASFLKIFEGQWFREAAPITPEHETWKCGVDRARNTEYPARRCHVAVWRSLYP